MRGKLLVTGVNGFTGKHFSLLASQKGYEVHGLKADLTDIDALRSEILRCEPDYVLHLGAISSVTHSDQIAFYRVNVLGSMNLLKVLCELENLPKKVLLASSANVYGINDLSPISEDCPTVPVNHYAVSKLAMEFMVKPYMDKLNIVIVRPFNYTGVGHSSRFIVPKLIEHFTNRLDVIELGDVSIEREFNDVRMVIDVYMRLLEHESASGVFNICSGNTVDIETIINMLEDLSGHNIKVNTNKSFIRDNEIRHLSGSFAKLESVIGKVEHPPLRKTLEWMLTESGD
jgi:nucleoside-diphosphate-sugar epimerase